MIKKIKFMPSFRHLKSIRYQSKNAQHGLTLVELMVGMAIGLLVTMAAVAALVVSRQGFNSVDASSQLRDNSRFIQELVQRLGVQAGYKDYRFAAGPPLTSTQDLTDSGPNIFGLNNSSRTTSNNWDEGTARTTGTVDYGSDILVLRYQTSALNTNEPVPVADGSMINCKGESPNDDVNVATDRYDRLISILHVGVGSDGEPSLMCTVRSADGTYNEQPLVQGVESFQVLYGVDGVQPNNTVVPITTTYTSVPNRYLRADQLTVAGNKAATYANWRRVRSLRIGMVLRASNTSNVDRTTQTYYPLGSAKGSGSGAVGSAFASGDDPGTTFAPVVDGKLRKAVTFTVHLRNYQDEN